MGTAKVNIKDVEGQVKIVEIEGVLDTLTTPEIDEIITPLIGRTEACLIIDCNKLEYMNSTGLAALMRYYIQMRRRKGCLKIVNPTETIYEIMDIAGAIKLLEMYQTTEQAIDSWRKK